MLAIAAAVVAAGGAGRDAARADAGEPARCFWRDPVGLSLAGAGLLAVGASGLLAWRAAQAPEGTSYAGLAGSIADCERDQTAAIALGTAGGALVAGALVWWWWLAPERGSSARDTAGADRRARPARLVVAPALVGQGGLVLEGRW